MKSSLRYQVFIDFDNTVTNFDVFDDIIKRFSINKDWLKWERAWQEGEIGSRRCLEEQLRSVRISKKKLLSYLSEVKTDPHLHKLLLIFRKNKIKPVILSDNFSFIIRKILRSNAIKGLKVFSNELVFDRDRIKPLFPRRNENCDICAHCKKNTLLKNSKNGKIKVYIGDGLSDVCAAICSDIIFAKRKLQEQFKKIGKDYIPISNMGDVYRYFKEKSGVTKAKSG